MTDREPTTPFGEPTPDCTDRRCSRIDGKCVGMHCARCGEPCSSQGHTCDGEATANPSCLTHGDSPCPTCSGPSRATVGMVCQTCGTDYGPSVPSGVTDREQLIAALKHDLQAQEDADDPEMSVDPRYKGGYIAGVRRCIEIIRAYPEEE